MIGQSLSKSSTSAPSSTVFNVGQVMDPNTDAFDEILSQLSALGSQIDQELTHTKYPKSGLESDHQLSSSSSSSPSSAVSHNTSGTVPQTAVANNETDMNYYSQLHAHPHQLHHLHPMHHSHVHSHPNYDHYGQTIQQQMPSMQPAAANGQSVNQNTTVNGSDNGTRTESPDNDSAFSDSISLISTEQSTSSSSSSSVSKSSSSRPTIGGQQSQSQSQSQPQPPNILPLNHSSTSQCVSASQLSPSINGHHHHHHHHHHLHDDLQSQSSISESGSSTNFDHQYHHSSSGAVYDAQKCELFFDQLGSNSGHSSQTSTPTKDTKKKIVSETASVSVNLQLQFCSKNIQKPNKQTDSNNNIKHDSSDHEDTITTMNSPNIIDLKNDLTKMLSKNLTKNGPEQCDNNHSQGVNTNKNDYDHKVKEALERIHEANFKKRFIKVFAQDNSSKSLLADERMTVGLICANLAEKNHIEMTMNQSIIEHMPHLYLERFYEDHESLVENVVLWDRNSPNKLFFMQRPEKYDMFKRPELYFSASGNGEDPNSTLKFKSSAIRGGNGNNNSNSSSELISSLCLQDGTGQLRLPEIKGQLHLRTEGKKAWKKMHFVLKSSGLYYCAKGKPINNSTKDLQCLITFEMNCVYFGIGWKKKYKAPTDYGFAIKNPEIQSKSPKHIKYLCADSSDELKLWINGIRMAKYGRTLLDNYERFRSDDNSNSVTNNGQAFNDNASSVLMRSNRIQCEDGARISCSSSSSGSVISTPSTGSGNTSVSNAGTGAAMQQFNSLSTSPVSSPSHVQEPTPPPTTNGQFGAGHGHYSGTSQPVYGTTGTHPPSLNGSAFEGGDFATIKRKPQTSGSMPKIPLTSTTRNLALQSDDALVEVNENEPEMRSIGASGNGPSNGGTVPTLYEDEIYSAGSEMHTLGRSTLRRSTLRRSINKPQSSPFTSGPRYSPQQSPPLPPPPPAVSMASAKASESEDETPLPPPPPPLDTSEMNLKQSESQHSLNQSFPPPPPEVVSISQLLPVPRFSGSMTPQPQPKNPANVGRITRRLSDLSSNSVGFNNWRNNSSNYAETGPSSFYATMGPHSRASIATVDSGVCQTASLSSGQSNSSLNYSSGNNNFATLKAFHTKTSPTSPLSPSHRTSQGLLNGHNKFGTAPRLRGGIDFNDYPPAVPSHATVLSPDTQSLPPVGGMSYGPPTVAPPPVPAHARQPSNSSAQASKESDYSSISPHLIAKHQAMVIQQQHHHHQSIQHLQSPTNHSSSHASIYGAYQPLPTQEIFLRNMERVMQKKWHVAQMLQQPPAAAEFGNVPTSPGDILAFRESAYLPPDAPRPDLPAFYGQPPPSPTHSFWQPPPQPQQQQQQQQIYSSQKMVRIADCPPTVINYGQMSPSGPGPEYSPSHHPHHQQQQQQQQQQIYQQQQQPQQFYQQSPPTPQHQQQPIYGATKRIPPPPPKRADSTHLTNGNQTSLRH